MSVFELTDKVVEAIDSKKFDVIIMNIANPDMVGRCRYQSKGLGVHVPVE